MNMEGPLVKGVQMTRFAVVEEGGVHSFDSSQRDLGKREYLGTCPITSIVCRVSAIS